MSKKEKFSDAGRLRTVSIAGTGSYMPERIMTNAELETMVETSAEWIVTRTGIAERRLAGESETTSDMGAEAARRALADAGVSPEEVDLIVLATITPDLPFPNTACLVQDKIGAKNAACFSLEAACSGFVFAMETARQFVATGAAKTALVVAAEKMSSIIDWTDRETCVLFGDGAGACVLKAAEGDKGLVHAVLGSNGALAELLMVPGGGSRLPFSEEVLRERNHYLKMEGREVFKHAVKSMTAIAQQVCAEKGLTTKDVACIVPHQANIRIIEAIGQRLGEPKEKFFINLDRYGNTSGASVIVALDEAVRSGVIKRGDLVMLLVFGGGFTWGASLLEWSK
ncbi:MAG TPA: beta-ketoacyl-ACP synthase III [Kiritimatiellia bacterium]|nr:beta-ketoacyl-ACP synthase III [Kiritimatiellia bacterium]